MSEQHPRQFIHPVGTLESCLKRVLQCLVESLHHPVRLRMIAGCVVDLRAQCCCDGVPKSRDKLASAVRGDLQWDAESSNPSTKERACTADGGDILQRERLGPSCGSVDDSEEVCVASARW